MVENLLSRSSKGSAPNDYLFPPSSSSSSSSSSIWSLICSYSDCLSIKSFFLFCKIYNRPKLYTKDTEVTIYSDLSSPLFFYFISWKSYSVVPLLSSHLSSLLNHFFIFASKNFQRCLRCHNSIFFELFFIFFNSLAEGKSINGIPLTKIV